MVAGGLLIIAGFVMLLQRFDIIYVGSIWHFWPFIFVAVGVSRIANGFNARDFGEGVWWIFLGLWLYVSIQHIYGLSFRETWPAMLIAWGASMIWKSYFSKSYKWTRG